MSILNKLDLFNLGNELYVYAVLLFVIVLFAFIFIKLSEVRVYILYFMCVVVIGFGIYSCFGLHSLLNVKSSDIGSVIHIDEKKDFNVISSFDFVEKDFDVVK